MQQQLQTVAQGFHAAMQENQQCYRVIDSLAPLLQVNMLLNQEIEAMDRALASIVPFMGMANVWMNDALAHEQVLDNLCYLISSPEYLVHWAFTVWNKSIQANGAAALDWISDEFMQLLDTFEAKFMAASGGQHSAAWHRRQNQSINPIMGSPDTQGFSASYQPQPQLNFQQQSMPMPPVPGVAGQSFSPLDQLKQRIDLQKSGTPDLAQQMQRAHVQQRQAMGVGGGW